jgi:16S rRNA (uracil1498-N3)-methyltransferase
MAYHVVLTHLDPKKASWDIVSSAAATGEPVQHVTICASLIRPERFEWLLQKSVEIGVTRIIPIICDRTRAESSSTQNKFSRWQRIVTEAAEQSCRGKIPELAPALALKEIRIPPADQVFWLHEGKGTLPLRQLLPTQRAPVWVFSGPEGGFSPDEQLWLSGQSGWHATGLGARILRAETAPIVAATLILAARGAYDDGAA